MSRKKLKNIILFMAIEKIAEHRQSQIGF